RGSLVAVVGPVGSGKSALLAALMGDMVPLLDEPGQVYPVVYGGSVGLAAQTPWIMHASVRENITFGQSFDEERYNAVVRASQLLPDFASFPHGDETIIGERGLTLSGGQKQRV
ncbi:P-loop containing nucleoside triphosphate hydrolase protein, partial [Ramicandelaber brevisporus]